tara:strand:- start:395 stop:598 length:204 start_codon:yes stop_codon:yes gene_type:complete
MAPYSYIGSSLDCHMIDEEYDAYESFMKDTFFCIICEAPHNRIRGRIHSYCQIDDSQDMPEDWKEML